MIYSPFFGRGQPGGNYPRALSAFFRVNHEKNRPGFSDCLIPLLGPGVVIIPPLDAERILKDMFRIFKINLMYPDILVVFCRIP
jgi:hypothetical protein